MPVLDDQKIVNIHHINPLVFVFDDEELFVKPFSRQLRKSGFRVHSAKDRKRAYRLIRSNYYDGYCVDIHTEWEYTFGIDLIKEIRRINPNPYIDIISGHPQHKKSLKKIGANHFTEKPIKFKRYAKELKNKIIKNIIHENYKLSHDFQSESMDNYITDTIKILHENEDIKKIMLDIFGKELPELSERVKKLENLYELSNSYLDGVKQMILNGRNLMKG